MTYLKGLLNKSWNKNPQILSSIDFLSTEVLGITKAGPPRARPVLGQLLDTGPFSFWLVGIEA